MMIKNLIQRNCSLPIIILLISFIPFNKANAAGFGFFNASAVEVDQVLSAITPFSYFPVIGEEEDFYEKNLTVFDELDLAAKGLEYEAYDLAIRGLDRLMEEGVIVRPEVISIADFSQPSTKKRLYVIDLENKEVLFNTYVSHGRNSGKVNAEKFSNRMSSFQSSIGFYTTSETYRGKHGYSLRLDGVDKGFNDNARNRAIVIHGADYVNEKLIGSQGYIGRSLGCPAVSMDIHKKLINTIKDGTLFFAYHPSENYLRKSVVLN